MIPPHVSSNTHPKQYNTHDTGVVNSSVRNIYFAKEALIQKSNAAAPKLHFGTATDQVQFSVGTGTLALSSIPSNFPCSGHVIPSFKHTLIGIGSICDNDCRGLSTEHAIVVYDPQQKPIIIG